jgi:hypothetical protein
MSLRNIKPILDKAYQEKERIEHKSLFVQSYDLFSNGKKTPLQAAIDLNIGQIQATQYYTEYLKLVQLDSVTQLYLELKGDIRYSVDLCKSAKSAKMRVQDVINLLRITKNRLLSVQKKT